MQNAPIEATGEAVSAPSLRDIIFDAAGDMHKVHDFALIVHERLTENRPISLELANAMSWLSCELVALGKRMSEIHDALHKAVIAVPDACQMAVLCDEYHRSVSAYEAGKAGLSDDDAEALYDRTIEPVRARMFDEPPVIQSMEGAAKALLVVLEEKDLVSTGGIGVSLLRSVSTYLDGRAAR